MKLELMCLAIPGKLLSIVEGNGKYFRKGTVSFNGISREVNLALVPDALVGDFVLVHVGVAIGTVDEMEAKRTLNYLQMMEDLEDLNLQPHEAFV